MRSELESIRICSVDESLCIVNIQDSHVSFNIHEQYIRFRIIEPVVTRAGSLEVLAGLIVPEHISKRLTARTIY
ncbi:MAG: hypothetical protein JXM72_12525 [Deltaproteobacteria bacterium]|nr:hypothetical protein [Deltaproteobacteria bacterium]